MNWKNYIQNNKKALNELKEVLIYTFIFGMIAHGYRFFNAQFSHDSLDILVSNESHREQMISIGRIFRPLFVTFRGAVSSPLLIGFVSLLFVGLSIFLTLDILEIKNRWHRILIIGLLTTNYSQSLLYATYIHDADSYGVALFLICLAVYLIKQNNKLTYFSPVLVLISLGIYQAYFQVGIFLLLILAIKKLLNKEDALSVFKQLVLQMILMLLGTILYYLLYKTVLSITGINQSSAYNSMSTIGKIISIEKIIENTIALINYEFAFIFGKNTHWKNLMYFINVTSILWILTSSLILLIKRYSSKLQVILVILIGVIMPIGLNLVCLLANGEEHDLMTYSFFLIYVFAIVLFELWQEQYKNNRIIEIVIIAFLLFINYSNIQYSNEIYFKKKLDEQSTLSYMTRIIGRIEQTDGYKVGETPVVFYGTPSASLISGEKQGFIEPYTGMDTNYSISKAYTYRSYFEYYLGYPINLIDYSKSGISSDVIENIPCYPNEGSVVFVNDVLVVKLSNYNY